MKRGRHACLLDAAAVAFLPPLPLAVLSAIQKIRQGMWGVLPTDKDGGFTLLRKRRLRDAFFDVLADSRFYEELQNHDPVDVIREYADVSREIATLGSDETDRRLLPA